MEVSVLTFHRLDKWRLSPWNIEVPISMAYEWSSDGFVFPRLSSELFPDLIKTQLDLSPKHLLANSGSCDDDLDMVGGAISFLWFDEQLGAFTNYVLIGAGAYRTQEDALSQVVLFLGPGFGGRITWGWISVGLEMNIQLGFAAKNSLMVVPVKVYALF